MSRPEVSVQTVLTNRRAGSRDRLFLTVDHVISKIRSRVSRWRVVKWYHKGLWNLYSRFESWPASLVRCQFRCSPSVFERRAAVSSDETSAESDGVAAVILAAGLGTRMRSRTPKELHPVCGRSMLEHVIRAASAASPSQIIVVLSPAKAAIADSLPENCVVAWQTEPLGTGHAAAQALPLIDDAVNRVAILFGDHPLLTGEAVCGLVDSSRRSGSLITLLTAVLPEPGAYGRLVYDDEHIVGIVEAKEDKRQYSGSVEINSGISCYDREWLQHRLSDVPRSSVGEYYLTSLVEMAAREGSSQGAVTSVVQSAETAYGVNDRVELAIAEHLMRVRINTRFMRAGVTIVDPASTFIDDTVTIEQDVRIEPFTIICGTSAIGEETVIGPHASIYDTRIGRGCVVDASTLESAEVEDRVHVGPYSHFRAGTRIQSGAHVGNFVEVKNSTIGEASHAGHFSYVGDATVGKNVNIGAGTITANYDGVTKHETIIEDDAFIGSDTILRAPVTVGKGARTGAGSVVTRDVSPGSTVVGLPARPIASKRGASGKREETER